MTKHDIAKAHCCNWHPATKACVFDKPCEPDACRYYDRVVVRCAAIAAGTKKGGKR